MGSGVTVSPVNEPVVGTPEGGTPERSEFELDSQSQLPRYMAIMQELKTIIITVHLMIQNNTDQLEWSPIHKNRFILL